MMKLEEFREVYGWTFVRNIEDHLVVMSYANEHFTMYNYGISFGNMVNGVVEEVGPQSIIVDLNGVEYVDSWGFGQLISGYFATRKRGEELVFCRVGKRIKDLFEDTNVSHVLEVYESRQEAWNAILAYRKENEAERKNDGT